MIKLCVCVRGRLIQSHAKVCKTIFTVVRSCKLLAYNLRNITDLFLLCSILEVNETKEYKLSYPLNLNPTIGQQLAAMDFSKVAAQQEMNIIDTKIRRGL